MLTRLCVLAAVAVLVAGGAAPADDKGKDKKDVEAAKALDGTYAVKGVNPDGKEYEGTCQIVHSAGNKVTVVWKYGKRSDTGTGTVEGDVLTVEYEGAIKDEREGKAVYAIKKGGKLDGTFKSKGSKRGTEVLTPAKDKEKDKEKDKG